jgi:agmatinase
MPRENPLDPRAMKKRGLAVTDNLVPPKNVVTGLLGAAGGYTDGRMVTTGDHRRFWGVPTFLRAPMIQETEKPTIGIVGLPFDGGSSRTSGSRFGPRGVRQLSCRGSAYNAELNVNPYEVHNIVDCGDVILSPFSITDTYLSIERAIRSLLDRNIMPVSVGGDHSVTLPILRAMHAKHGELAVVQFDAHCDVSDTAFGSPYHYGSMFRRAIEEGLVRGDQMIQVGIRKHYHRGEIEFLKENKFELITTNDMKRMGPAIREEMTKRFARLRGKKVYVTFDIDCIDHAYAPGIGSPEPFGPTSYESVEALRALTVLASDIVGFDLVEISPQHDVNDMTSYLGVQLLFEMVSIVPPTRSTGPT